MDNFVGSEHRLGAGLGPWILLLASACDFSGSADLNLRPPPAILPDGSSSFDGSSAASDGTLPDAGAGDSTASDGGPNETSAPDAGADEASAPDAKVSEGGPTEAGAGAVSFFGADHITSPQHIAIEAATQAIYVANFAGSVVKFDANLQWVATYGTSGAGQLTQAVGVAVDANGNVFVGDYGARKIVEFDGAGTYKATFTGAESGLTLGRIGGVAIAQSGHVFASDDDNSRIVEFDDTGAVVSQYSTILTPPGGLAGTVGIGFDPSGNLWNTDYYYHVIAKYGPGGTRIGEFGAFGSTAAPGQFAQPYALAVDSRGNVLVTDNANNDVQEFDGVGRFALFVDSDGGSAPVGTPTGIAVDARGRVLVSDSANNRIVVLPEPF